MKAGIALNPATPIAMIKWLLPYLDLVMLMTVEPGYAGQTWFPSMADKVQEVRRLVSIAELPIEIEVDGNINPSTIPVLVRGGATVLVGGSSGLFQANKPLRTSMVEMRQAVANSRHSNPIKQYGDTSRT